MKIVVKRRGLKHHPVATTVGAVALTGFAILIARSLPDIARYIRIERM